MELPFEDSCFGLVACFEAIEHVSDHKLALSELERVLAPGGLLAISTPNRGVYREDNPFHVYEMTSEELRDELASRFANVRLYRQQVHMASLLSTDNGQASADPSAEIPASVRKLASQQPGEELYAVALAGDGELPGLPNVVMLAGGVLVREWQDTAAAWEERARRAEAECDAMEVELGHLGRSKTAVLEELEELRRRVAAAGRAGKRIFNGD
jgi:SAM-dependent methyltransferase